jgi:hypothetical protein
VVCRAQLLHILIYEEKKGALIFLGLHLFFYSFLIAWSVDLLKAWSIYAIYLYCYKFDR